MAVTCIYYEQHSVPDGLRLIKQTRNMSDITKLVKHYLSQGKALRCWCCHREVNAVITMQEKGNPYVFNAFAHVDGHMIERYSVDHIIPKAFGGRDKMDNYRLSCITCNNTRDIDMTDAEIIFLSNNTHLCKDGGRVYNNLVYKVSPHYYYTTVQQYDQAHYVY